MEELFVSLEVALLAKQHGFNDINDFLAFGEFRQWDGNPIWLQLYQDLDSCSTDDADYQYTTEALAPLIDQLKDWFLYKHNIYITDTYHRQKGFNAIIDTDTELKFVGYYANKHNAFNEAFKQAFEMIKKYEENKKTNTK